MSNPESHDANAATERTYVDGDAAADNPQLFAQIYTELKRRAGKILNHERSGHTLQPTALVHEVYLRLAEERKAHPKNRAHLLSLGSLAMRRVLIDYARAHTAKKRGQGKVRITLSGSAEPARIESFEDLIDLDDAIRELERLDERQARVVELRFFGGLTAEETAEALDISKRTADSDWKIARAWLHRRLSERSATS